MPLADNTITVGMADKKAPPQRPVRYDLGGDYIVEPGPAGTRRGKHQQHQERALPASVNQVINANLQGGTDGRVEHHQAQDPDLSHEGYSDGPQGGIVNRVARYFSATLLSQSPRDIEMDRLRSELNERSIHLENHQQEIRHLQQELQALRSQITNVKIIQADREKLSEANDSLQYELINVKKQLEEVKSLADIRGKELLGAQKCPTKADSISVSNLKDKVGALNDKICQAAASLGETITHHSHGLPKEEENRIYLQTVQMIGEPISLMVVEEGHKPNAEANPLLVQVVLQVFMTKWCASKIELWIPNDVKLSDFLRDVYMNIQTGEEPAVFGRSRALTQAHTRPVKEGWKEDLISSLMKIFKIAAWKTPDRDQRLSFERKLVSIFKAVEDLRIAIGEKITSAYIQLLLVPPNSQFASDWMNDAFADARVKVVSGGPIQCVIGTTNFGLKKMIPGQRGRSGEMLFESVLAPKVILESTLREALNPPPRQPKTLHKTTQKLSHAGCSANTSVRRNDTNEELVDVSPGTGSWKEVIYITLKGAQASESDLSPQVVLKRTVLEQVTSQQSQMCGKD